MPLTRKRPEKPEINGVTEFWCRVAGSAVEDKNLAYRPAVLVECTLNFRSLRAGLNHSEERNYTAWLPEGDLAIDWDAPAANLSAAPQLVAAADPDLPYHEGRYLTSAEDLRQHEAALVDLLVRNERLCVYYGPSFEVFSAPGQALDSFLPALAEKALERVEPELKKLHARFELQLEQVREAQLRKGLNARRRSLESVITRNLELFESENRLAAMFSTLAGNVFGAAEPRREQEHANEEIELREDLDRVEEEASEALRVLYAEYTSLANEYDIFEIGLQPDNIQVMRRALLWVPVEGLA